MLIATDVGTRKKLTKSGLLGLWTLVSFIFSNFYSAVITSLMIIPPGDEPMTEISHLLENNYILIFPNQRDLNIVNATVNYVKTKNNDLNASRALISRGAQITGTHGITFGKTLAFTKHVAAIDLWHNVLAILEFANAALELNAENAKKHCYIGKKLIPSGDLFQIFTPPKGGKHAKLAKNLLETGFYSFWYTELRKMQYSSRVQERSKVKEPTDNVFDFEDITASEFKPLKFEGRIKSVFFGCIIMGSLGSFSGFIMEHLWKYFSNCWSNWKKRECNFKNYNYVKDSAKLLILSLKSKKKTWININWI